MLQSTQVAGPGREKAKSAPAPADTLSALAREVVLEHQNYEAATDELFERIKADKALHRLISDALLRSACYETVALEGRKIRAAAWRAPGPSAAAVGRYRRGLLATAVSSLTNGFLLDDGKPLGQATGAEVAQSSQRWLQQATALRVRGLFLKAVAERVESDRRVADVLTEDDLQALRDAVLEG